MWTIDELREAVEREVGELPAEVLEVRAEGSELVIEFATSERPGCRFGFRWPGFGGVPEDSVETYATDARWNLQEIIEAEDLGLPRDCGPGPVTWVG